MTYTSVTEDSQLVLEPDSSKRDTLRRVGDLKPHSLIRTEPVAQRLRGQDYAKQNSRAVRRAMAGIVLSISW